MISEKLGVSQNQPQNGNNAAKNSDSKPNTASDDFFDIDENMVKEMRRDIIVQRKDSSRKVFEKQLSKQIEKTLTETQNEWDESGEDEEGTKELKSPDPVIIKKAIKAVTNKFSSPQTKPMQGYFGHDSITENDKGKDYLADNFPLAQGKPLVIGVCGGNCAGKMDLVNHIIKRIGKRHCTIVKQENFYKSLPEKQGLDDFNYDDPDATDWELMEEGLDALLVSKKPFDTPVYNLKLNKRDLKTEQIWPNPIIIVEGLLIYHIVGIRKRINLKIFVDTDDDVRLSRRVIKDCVKLGRNVNQTIERYKRFVKPCHENYVSPSKKYADIILPDFGSTICEEIEYMDKNKTETEKTEDESKSNAPFKLNLALELMIEQINNELEIQHDIRVFKKQLI